MKKIQHPQNIRLHTLQLNGCGKQNVFFNDNRVAATKQKELLNPLQFSTVNCNQGNIIQGVFSNRNDIIADIVDQLKDLTALDLTALIDRMRVCRVELGSGDPRKASKAIDTLYFHFFGRKIRFDVIEARNYINWIDVCDLFTTGAQKISGPQKVVGDGNDDINLDDEGADIKAIKSKLQSTTEVNRCMSQAEYTAIGDKDTPVFHLDGFKIMCFSLGKKPGPKVSDKYPYKIRCRVPGGTLYQYLKNKRVNLSGNETTFDSFMVKTVEDMVGIPPAFLSDFSIIYRGKKDQDR